MAEQPQATKGSGQIVTWSRVALQRDGVRLVARPSLRLAGIEPRQRIWPERRDGTYWRGPIREEVL